MRMIPERRQIVHVWQNWDHYSVEELPGLPPISDPAIIEEEVVMLPQKMSIRSNGPFLWVSSLCPRKKRFRSLILSFPFEIDYTTIDSRGRS